MTPSRLEPQDLAACPFCSAALEPFGPDQANHPKNDCWLSSVGVRRNEFERWNRRAEGSSTSTSQSAAPTEYGPVHVVGDLVRNLLTLDQVTPIYAAFHVDFDGARRCRTRPVMVSRERVINGKWVDSTRKDVPYAVIVWAKPQADEGNSGAAPGDALDAATHTALVEVLNTTLWLYRRLPHAYANPPFVDQAITTMARHLGMEHVPDAIKERVAIATSISKVEGK